MGDQVDELTPGDAKDLERDVAFAVRRHARAYFRFAKHGDTAPASIAMQIVAYLRLANWKFFRGRPAPPHSTGQRAVEKNQGEPPST
jgi:hypothetical protein